MLYRSERRETDSFKLGKKDAQLEVWDLRAELARAEKYRDKFDKERAKATAVVEWLVSLAFPDISLTRNVRMDDAPGLSFSWNPTYVDGEGITRYKQVRKTVAELETEIKAKLERDKFNAMTQKQQLQYLFDQKQKADRG